MPTKYKVAYIFLFIVSLLFICVAWFGVRQVDSGCNVVYGVFARERVMPPVGMLVELNARDYACGLLGGYGYILYYPEVFLILDVVVLGLLLRKAILVKRQSYAFNMASERKDIVLIIFLLCLCYIDVGSYIHYWFYSCNYSLTASCIYITSFLGL